MSETPQYQLSVEDHSWLKQYCLEQYKRIITPTSVYWERYALTCYDEFITMNIIYGISLNNEYIGYAIVPSYELSILKSLFITPQYRRQGIGSNIIDALKITQLSCIAENTNALRIYEQLGFKVIETNDPFKGSLKLERTL